VYESLSPYSVCALYEPTHYICSRYTGQTVCSEAKVTRGQNGRSGSMTMPFIQFGCSGMSFGSAPSRVSHAICCLGGADDGALVGAAGGEALDAATVSEAAAAWGATASCLLFLGRLLSGCCVSMYSLSSLGGTVKGTAPLFSN